MSTAVALVCRVVRRRMERGEKQRAEIIETLSKG